MYTHIEIFETERERINPISSNQKQLKIVHKEDKTHHNAHKIMKEMQFPLRKPITGTPHHEYTLKCHKNSMEFYNSFLFLIS